jgi:hypothetical protein
MPGLRFYEVHINSILFIFDLSFLIFTRPLDPLNPFSIITSNSSFIRTKVFAC